MLLIKWHSGNTLLLYLHKMNMKIKIFNWTPQLKEEKNIFIPTQAKIATERNFQLCMIVPEIMSNKQTFLYDIHLDMFFFL